MNLSEIHIRDPFILVDENKYYLYGTRGGNAHGPFSGLDTYVSDDLKNWSEAIEVFHRDADFWATEDCWAPEVHKYKDKYYMFVSYKSETKHRGTQILSSDSPLGPFVEHSNGAITPKDWECLDGTLYISQDEVPYLVFCHEWQQILDGEIVAVQLSEDLKETVGEPFLLFKASDPTWADGLETSKGLAYVTDGVYFSRLSDGTLVLTWSSFFKENYIVAVAYSDNGEITGNWIHSEKFIFDRDGGHGMVFETNKGDMQFIMHSPNTLGLERPRIVKFDVEKIIK